VSIDPTEAAGALAAAKVAGDVAKALVIDPAKDVAQDHIKEWMRERILPYVERILPLGKAALLAADDADAKLAGVPVEKRVPPDPVVAKGVIEALQTRYEDRELREMFANLLANAMHIDHASEAHPAFVEVIRQMSAEDARLFRWLADRGSAVREEASGDATEEAFGRQVNDAKAQIAAETGLVTRGLVDRGLSSLERLGLIRVEALPMRIGRDPIDPGNIVIRALTPEWTIALTTFGAAFAHVCTELAFAAKDDRA
jgi:hypothetical protein